MSLASAQSPVYDTYVNSQEGFTQYVVPNYGQLQSFNETSDAFGNKILTFTLAGSVPAFNTDRITVEAYYDTPAAGMFDRGVIGVTGNYTYESASQIFSGQAGVVDTSNFSQLQAGTISVSGNTIQVIVPATAVGGPAAGACLVMVRYLPATADAVGGMNDAGMTSQLLDTTLEDRRIVVPSHPSPSGLRPGSGRSNAGKPQLPLRFNDTKPIPSPGDSCPPRGIVPKPGDINGDGVTDWDYPVDMPLGSGGKLIDVWGIDLGPVGGGRNSEGNYDDCYIIVVGNDDNGNGKLEAGEIDFAIGACMFYGGWNYGWVDKATNVVHWVNEEYVDSNGNGLKDPGERLTEKRHYIYNPNTGKLKVYHDPDGDGPLPPVLEWPVGNPSGGDPRDYPDWPGGFDR